MAIRKWIGGVLGWIASGGSILGALAGYCIGSLLDDAFDSQDNSGGGSGRTDDAYSNDTYEGARNSFLFSMLALASYIIKADGKIMHSEMEFVRMFLRQNFGEQAVVEGEQILSRLFEEQKRQGAGVFHETIRKSCVEIRFHMNYSMRLQLLSFLVMIAKADGNISPEELTALKEVAQVMGVSSADLESVLAMGYYSYQEQQSYNSRGSRGGGRYANYNEPDELANAYKILGISPSSTDDEVKKAYRQMALKHHPDRVATLGDDVRKASEKKFQEINHAKDVIYKARGL
mgnify:FL=1